MNGCRGETASADGPDQRESAGREVDLVQHRRKVLRQREGDVGRRGGVSEVPRLLVGLWSTYNRHGNVLADASRRDAGNLRVVRRELRVRTVDAVCCGKHHDTCNWVTMRQRLTN